MDAFRTIFCLFCLSAAPAARAQQTTLDTVNYIEAVSVTARRVAHETIPAQTLSGGELRRLGTVSVADAIRYFSGVQIKDYGGVGGLKTVNVRSLGSQHVGVFYDGMALGNAQNGQIDLGRFSMDNLEAISLYNGQKSTVLQPARDFASAGAVYLTARRPRFADGRRDNLRLGFKGGSFGTVNPSGVWEHRFGERLDASLNAEYLYTSGRYRFTYATRGGYDTTAVRQNGDVRALRVEGGLYGKTARGEWRTRLYLYDSERGYPGASVREEPGKFRNEDRQRDRNFFVQSSLRQHYGRYSLLLNAKYARDFLHYRSDPRLDLTTMHVDDRYRQQEFYASAAHEWAGKEWWRTNVSTDVQYNTLWSDRDDFAHPTRLTALVAVSTALDFRRFDLQASLLYTGVRDGVKTPGGAAPDRDRWTPTLIAAWKPVDELSLRAFYKRVFRMPTLNDLYYTLIGNKSLDPEFADQYNLGAVYDRRWVGGPLRRVEVQLDAYYNEVNDKIVALPGSNQFQWTMLNLGYVEIRGVDAAVRGGFELGKVTLDARLSYTWQRAQDFTDPGDPWYGGQIPYIPRHSGAAVVGAGYKSWELNYSFVYTGERWESRANTPENHIQPWYTHDLALGRTLGRLRLSVEVNNLLNQQYEVVKCYPMPGTNVKIKINWEL